MTRPFRFSLQRILDIRRQQEEKAQMELAQAENRLKSRQQEAEALSNELQRAGTELAAKPQLTPDELWMWRSYKERILLEMRSAERELQELETKVNECRREALEQSKERRKLEKLRENKALEHKHTEERKEQQVLDEMATLRYTKRFV